MEFAVKISDRASKIYNSSLVWDMTVPYGVEDSTDGVTLPRFKEAGFNVLSLSVGGDKTFGPDVALYNIAKIISVCSNHSDMYSLVNSVGDINRARKENKLAIMFNFQGTNVLGNNIELIELFYRLGVRHMLLSYNQKNLAGDGCSERTNSGLSRYGILVIEEMNRVGMLVDGTHCGHQTTMEAMECTKSPFIFSHCNAYSVFAHYRNIKDDQIKKCAKTGGVIGVNGLGEFLDDLDAKSESMFKHIDYISNLVGPQHVGIGIDYVKDVEGFWKYVDDTPEAWPPNFNKPNRHTKFVQPEQIQEVVELMCRNNYSDNEIRGILGENFFRVCKQVWN